MLKSLSIVNVGPMANVKFAVDPRLNVFTGDNGLGKSLLLDIAFWAESGVWPRARAVPLESKRNEARLAWTLSTDAQPHAVREAHFMPRIERWRRKTVEGVRPDRRPVIVYAMVDGGFAVYDQVRAALSREDESEAAKRPPQVVFYREDDHDFLSRIGTHGQGYYVFTADEVFDGLRGRDDEQYVSNGLVRDWADWQYRYRGRFAALRRALATLSSGIGEKIVPGRPRRVSSRDARDIPSIKLPYGEIPITQASAAMRRVLGLAYMLVWAWTEHVQASRLAGLTKTSELLFIFDEVECHLHPKWQRVILPALMEAIKNLSGPGVSPQILAATHSPLVLASLEPLFDEERDQLLLVELTRTKSVRVTRRTFTRMGRADVWLQSDMFGLAEPMSKPAEVAVAKAMRMLAAKETPTLLSIRAAQESLGKVLSDTDPLHSRLAAMARARSSPHLKKPVRRAIR